MNEKIIEKAKLKDVVDNKKNSFLSKDTVSYLNEIVKAGFKERASDIHVKFDLLEGMEIKYRVDGYLKESQKLYEAVNRKVLEKNITEIIARMKILAGMNVAEKRKPQDGSFSFLLNAKNTNKRYDIRAAYMPTAGGETMVLRILENYLKDIKLETLGFSSQSIKMLNETLDRKYGMILVSGPTGSGKSTTLKSLINMLNNGRKKIITVEDPVESKINGTVQIQINQEIGVTFSEVLKATLRNDPDIIVISEIRDEITAEIAVRAALTGHLVISTIHTNDAVSTLIRLVDMGIPKYLILDSLIGVIGQRLVGKRCQKCMGEGCDECSSGYSGRISINEILVLNQDVRNILKEDNHLGSETKNKLKTLNQKYENQKCFIDFMEDANEKIEKKLIFEREKGTIIF
ncbi:MAG: type II/IV secretion system protein [Leptotrichia wadei]|jgi:general secretion pathway protein E|uniref:GspE/PulE family protein n=1 Tax=Leptotrichia wadei TaxID=157687 RepID=UPI0026F36C98|nr:GspE/PulE family protein [Leptotrichia wadei]MBS6020571.1 type II/IV secretion system protein [Leptotrichia wadei]